MIYLASPWSHPDANVRRARHEAAVRATVALMQAGHLVYSPIVYSVPLHEAGMDGDWDTWNRFDSAIIERCSFVWVLALEGWERSKGVQAEIDIAGRLNKPVRVLTLDEALQGGH